MGIVHILRGLPGSGKTYWAKQQDAATIVSADDYRIVNGQYVFAKDDRAHDKCLREFARILDLTAIPNHHIIVDNTNVSALDIAPYYKLAQAYNLDAEIVHFYCRPELALRRNTHGVPLETILKMYYRLLEPLPTFYRERVILAGE